MKTRRLLIVTMLIIAAFSVLMASCAEPEPAAPATFESFIESNPDIRSAIDESAKSGKDAAISYEISGNDITYEFDLATMEDMTEEAVKSEIVSGSLEAGLKDQDEYFRTLVNSLAHLSKIDGIRVIVNYIFEGETILSKTYEADPLPEPAEEEGQ